MHALLLEGQEQFPSSQRCVRGPRVPGSPAQLGSRGDSELFVVLRAASEHLHQVWWAQRHLTYNWESVLGDGGCWTVS